MKTKNGYEYVQNIAHYSQKSIINRLEAFFLDNVGKIVTNEDLKNVAKNPDTGVEPENWHQRLSELRVNSGYTILSKRDRSFLDVGEYLMLSNEKRAGAGARVKPSTTTWQAVLERSKNACEWTEGGIACGLKEGEVDFVGGGTVKLTADHMVPHSVNPNPDPNNPADWQALCGRHQVVKKNYWDTGTGKLNTIAIMQSLPAKEKQAALSFLADYFHVDVTQKEGGK
ncbi:hypothetical protein P0D68_17810 [Paraburkholderia sp. RL17-380-BIE-A]|uniref:hypothetical protein n=1 Tax=Paraburkholderia sp. RL17-380-BIE-A TaxID=3031630 RepID=UPI0038BA62CF